MRCSVLPPQSDFIRKATVCLHTFIPICADSVTVDMVIIMLKRCYIYTRVSTTVQVDGFSLDAQRDKLLKYAAYQDMEIVGEYSDAGKSGKNIDGRPDFQRMLSDIKNEKDDVTFVLVFKLSRFGRNAADVLTSLQIMQNHEVNLICVDDGIDSSKDSGKLVISVLSAVAEIERENILAQTIQLTSLFKKAGIKADFIVSSVKDAITGVTISREDNERKLDDYRNGKLQVLINVNILTEGVDLPKTKTVFLARPTVSSILMTQMVGRALRGTAAGGTASAYIVSFVDHWNEHIAWVNPDSLFYGNNDFQDNDSERAKRDLRMIAISKIEEFAAILDDAVDTTALERVPFEQRIPVGMYAFTYLEENGMDHAYQVMVYDSTQDSYKNLMDALPSLFKSFGAAEEYLTETQLDEMEAQCRNSFFCGEMIPPYERKDVLNILRYYAQYEAVPSFYTFDEVDRSKLDVSTIAKHIWDEDMGERKRTEYIDSLWESSDDNMLRLFFGRKLYFLHQLNIELMKLSHPDIYDDENNVKYGTKALKDLPLHEIGKINPALEKELRDQAFEKAKDANGNYRCACCGVVDKSRIYFQVDHIIPMNKGGKSVAENLQILCRQCNGTKGDQ